MVVPVRFGTGGFGMDVPDLSGYKITYTAPHQPGETFILHTMFDAEADEQRVVLKEGGFAGGSGSVDFTTHESVNRYGVRPVGFKVPEFTGSLDVAVRRGPDESVMDTMRDWRRAWSHFDEGLLKVVARDGGNREARVRLVGFSDVPHDPAQNYVLEDQVQFRCMDGYWRGPTLRRNGVFEVAVPGDLPPLLRLRWDGSETSFRLPSGLRVSLTRAAGTRFINLERGMQGQITREDGTVDSLTWSSLRGVLVGETLTPHRLYSFELGAGLELLATPRYLTPWR